jgi:CRISPR-associated protein Cmr4
MTSLLPADEEATRLRLKDNIVVLPDADASYLCQSAVPVQARIQLGEGKTTSRYTREDGTVDEGNLWYEETLPADALFTFFVAWRRDAKSVGGGGQKSPKEDVGLGSFLDIAAAQRHVQIGGNETVGQGWCWWTFQGGNGKEDKS